MATIVVPSPPEAESMSLELNPVPSQGCLGHSTATSRKHGVAPTPTKGASRPTERSLTLRASVI
jgi:hypothetical protein